MKRYSLGIEASGGGERTMCVRHAEFDKECFGCWQVKVDAEGRMGGDASRELPVTTDAKPSFYDYSFYHLNSPY